MEKNSSWLVSQQMHLATPSLTREGCISTSLKRICEYYLHPPGTLSWDTGYLRRVDFENLLWFKDSCRSWAKFLKIRISMSNFSDLVYLALELLPLINVMKNWAFSVITYLLDHSRSSNFLFGKLSGNNGFWIIRNIEIDFHNLFSDWMNSKGSNELRKNATLNYGSLSPTQEIFQS